MLLKALSILGRLGALVASLIVLGLGAKFITVRSWLTDFLIFIEVVAAVGVVGALVPPYPNFLYDLVWGVVWILAAVFALIVQILESNCYGLQPDNPVSCASYKAGTAFAFLALFSWLGSAFFGGLRIIGLLANVDNKFFGRPLVIGSTPDDSTVDPEKIRKVKGAGNSHIARYFICYGILAVVLLGVGIPMLVLYAAPAFARYLIEGVPIPPNINITLSNPSNDSIGFEVISGVHIPATGKVSFDPMHVSFFLADEQPSRVPIASVDLPALSFSSGEQVTIQGGELKLADLDEFARFIEVVAFQPNFTLGGFTKTKFRAGAISTWVDLDKILNFKGFNGFPSIEIPELALTKPDDEGYNVKAKIGIDNPTPASVTLGDVTLSLLIGKTTLGPAKATVSNILPGKNIFDVSAKVNIASLRADIEPILRTEIPYLKNESIMASASITSVVYEGEHLRYWEEAFGRLKVNVTRPVRPLLKTVLDSGVVGDGFDGIVEGVLDNILDRVKEMDGDEMDDYAAELADLAGAALNLFESLGIL